MKQGTTKSCIEFGCLNARSICNKVPAVLELLSDKKIDVCFLTESWLKVNDNAKFAEIREYGYSILSAPRKGRGGGVGFIFNSSTIALKRNNVSSYKSFEVLEALIRTNEGLIRLSVVYRTTQVSSKQKYADTRLALFYQEFSDYLDEISTKVGKPIISGDFNLHVEDLNDCAAKKFLDLCTAKGFSQHNSLPTYGDSTLDLVLTSDAICDEVTIKDLHVVDESPSDHSLVCFKIPCSPCDCEKSGTTTTIKEVRHLSNIDLDKFKSEIVEHIPHVKDIKSLEEAVDLYNDILSNILDKHAPIKTVQFREGKNPWWSSKCQDARNTRRAAERKYKKDRDQEATSVKDSHSRYKEAQVDAAITIDHERNHYYKEKLSLVTGDVKATYKVVNGLLDKEYGLNKLPNGQSDTEIANNLKDFFHNKIHKIYSDIEESTKKIAVDKPHHDYLPTSNVRKSKFFKIMTPDDVASVINKMTSKSCEYDPIPTWLIKNCLEELLPFVTLIINLSLQSGVFPHSMKSAIVRATLKKSNLDSDVLNNYRPISNLSFLSKVLEKCVHDQLTELITQSDLFAKHQSGYRKGHSCDTAVLKIQNDTLLMIDKKSHVVLMLLDLSAAFDTVNQ